MAPDVAAIASAESPVNRLAVELGQQDVCDCVEHWVGRALEQVGHTRVEFTITQTDGVVDGYERIKANMHWQHWRARAQFPVGFVEDFGESGGHLVEG